MNSTPWQQIRNWNIIFSSRRKPHKIPIYTNNVFFVKKLLIQALYWMKVEIEVFIWEIYLLMCDFFCIWYDFSFGFYCFLGCKDVFWVFTWVSAAVGNFWIDLAAFLRIFTYLESLILNRWGIKNFHRNPL